MKDQKEKPDKPARQLRQTKLNFVSTRARPPTPPEETATGVAPATDSAGLASDDESGSAESYVGPEPRPRGRNKSRSGVNQSPFGRAETNWVYKSGLKEEYPPIHDINAIFKDITKTALKLGMRNVIDHLADHKLKVATMCSGTESPLLALSLVTENLKQMGLRFEIDHLFSAEIVPYKQAYIERNFSPPVIFRDIMEMVAEHEATTVYGAKVPVPGGVDLLVAGSSCVDYSTLNSNPNGKGSEPGESKDTLRAVVHYAKVWRPKLIILENVISAPWAQMEKQFADAGYAAKSVKLDTKQYYIPHTRQRGYMICIDMSLGDKSKAAVVKWSTLMKSFERQASSPVEAFLLPDDDPRVQRGRTELSKDSSRGDGRANKETDWTICQGRHMTYREANFLGSRRPVTGWQENGSCRLPDYMWADWGKAQVERIWDTLDIAFLRNVRRSYDSMFKTRVWELSQNVDRFTDTTPFGITNCVTPTGSPFITTRGGPMVGLEALAMQGLPFDRLLLTRENQRQLQDLAGNAMSSTVVGSAMLAALIVGHVYLDKGSEDSTVTEENHVRHYPIIGEGNLVSRKVNLAHFEKRDVDVIQSLAQRSARLCLCEGREMVTSKRLQRCIDCGHSSCQACGGIPVHQYRLLDDEEVKLRLNPMIFETELKNALPMCLKLTGLTIDTLNTLKADFAKDIKESRWSAFEKGVSPALGVELRYHSMIRAEIWTVKYDAPTAILELVISKERVEWRAYAKPASNEAVNSPVRALLQYPYARMQPRGEDLLAGNWEFCLPTKPQFNVTFKGAGRRLPAWEALLGLKEDRFANKGVWSAYEISAGEDGLTLLGRDISGTYVSLPNCGKAENSLHRRISNDGSAPIYLFLDPSRYGDPKDDCFVFSEDIRRLNFGESRVVLGRLHAHWRPFEGKARLRTTCSVVGNWLQCPGVALEAISGKTATVGHPEHGFILEYHSEACHSANAVLSIRTTADADAKLAWKLGRWTEIGPNEQQSFFSSFSWLTERSKSINGLDDWTTLTGMEIVENCQECAPVPPLVRWKLEKEAFKPYEDPEKAAPYERALKSRPNPFVIQVKPEEGGALLIRIGLNITSLLHRAAATLRRQRPFALLSSSWRLTSNFSQPEKSFIPRFILRSNRSDPLSAQPPNFQHRLRPEQLRSLAWMVAQDCKPQEFKEEEIEEALLPNLGWRVEAKVEETHNIRGGVVADQVGYGKTALSLGLFDIRQPIDRMDPLPEIPGKIAVRATLIVVPQHLTNQWEDEIHKFLGFKYKVLVIKTQSALMYTKFCEVLAADLIIIPWALLNNDTYLSKLAYFAALPEKPAGAGRAFDAWYAYALDRVADHVEELKSNYPQCLNVLLQSKLAKTKADEQLTYTVPSKRLRGKAYRQKKLAEASAEVEKQPEASGKKRKASRNRIDDEADEFSEGDISDAAGIALPKLRGRYDDPFGLFSTFDRTQLRCPLFQFFHFKRLIIDEFTYLEGKNHTCVRSLAADIRWILSGTPPLDDFSDIKSIASFLDVHLGIDDAGEIIKRGRYGKDITEAEKFHAFGESKSMAWHMQRHGVAQKFLDQFVRQNVAEIKEIPSFEHIMGVTLPAAEQAIYLELQTYLLAQDLKVRRGHSKGNNDREKRLLETLGESKSADEALIKRSSHFTLDHLEEGQENAAQACEVIVAERKRQFHELIQDIKQVLKHAVWLQHRCKDDNGHVHDAHYSAWIQTVNSNQFGDAGTTERLREFIEEAKREYCVRDERLFYRGTRFEPQPVDDKVKYSRSYMDAEIKRRFLRRGRGKAAAKRNGGSAAKDEDGESQGQGESQQVNEAGSDAAEQLSVNSKRRRTSKKGAVDDDDDDDDPRPPKLTELKEFIAALRGLSHELRRLSTEMVSRIRSLRFFEAVRSIQLATLHEKTKQENHKRCECSCCKKSNLGPGAVSVLTVCGHTVCDDCLKSLSNGETCIVPGCEAMAMAFHVIRGTELGEEDEKAGQGRHFGKKLEEVVRLIKRTPKDDQVIIFVQFEDLMWRVSEALAAKKISHFALIGQTGKKLADMLSSFQKDRCHTMKKVLVLNVANESASGANLTNVNHLIFLSPLLTETQSKYDALMTQAIGRARRFGQKKAVHIYHFLSLKTIDVNVFEARQRKKLVRAGKVTFALIPPESYQALVSPDLGTGDLARFRAVVYDQNDSGA